MMSASDTRSDVQPDAAPSPPRAQRREDLQDTLDAIPSLVVVLDPQQRIVRLNERFERITGKRRDRVLSRTIQEVFEAPEDEGWCQDLTAVVEAVMATGKPARLVGAKVTKRGRRAHFQIRGNPIFNQDLEVAEVVVSALDVTELVLLKRETEEAARRFEQITDAVHGLITIKDVDEGRYLMVNPWVEEVVGIPRSAMIGKTAAAFVPPETAAQIQQLDREAIEKGERTVSQEIITVGNQERFLVSERIPLTDYKGDVVAICCVSQDVTRRRELQRNLIQSEQLAAVGKLAAGVAHEINNPLTGILTFAEDLVLQAADEDPLRSDYETIVRETMRCRRIVRNLLDFSRQTGPRRRPVTLNELVARVLPLVERQASFREIEFVVSADPGLLRLEVDPQQIQQVLLNLVLNARDAMGAVGRISIHGEPSDDERSVVLSVTDTGCGIPEDRLEEIFEPFYSTKGKEGHGLGLTAVCRVIERHGGRIEVESEVGVGTTFKLALPAAPGGER